MILEELIIYESKIGAKSINFSEGINIIVGPNGTGKSTILNMIEGKEKNATYMLKYKTDFICDYPLQTVNKSLAQWNEPSSEVRFDGEKWVSVSNSGGSAYRYIGEGTPIDEVIILFVKGRKSIHFVDGGKVSVSQDFSGVSSLRFNSDDDLSNTFKINMFNVLENILNNIFLKEKITTGTRKKSFLENHASEFADRFNKSINIALVNNKIDIKEVIFEIAPLNDSFDIDVNKIMEEIKFKTKFDEIVKISELSSGQKRSFLLSMILSGGKWYQLMLDEPTNFMSPHAIFNFAKKIKQYDARKQEGQVIINTHNPLLISDIYKTKPFIIKVTESSTTYINLKEISEKYEKNFIVGNSSKWLINSLFAKEILIVEGVDDMRMIQHNSQLSSEIDENEISIWPAKGSGVAAAVKFCVEHKIPHKVYIDEDLENKGQIIGKFIETKRKNIEEYLLDEVIESTKAMQYSKKSKVAAAQKYHLDGKLPYVRELYDEIWGVVSSKELPTEYTFEIITK